MEKYDGYGPKLKNFIKTRFWWKFLEFDQKYFLIIVDGFFLILIIVDGILKNSEKYNKKSTNHNIDL
jgi:hypothetical protein